MKKIMTGMLATTFVAAALAATSTPQGFTDNLDEALKSAKANKRYVVAVFSGSDWCGWCKKLEKEILSTEAFRKGAVGTYELVYIDSPRNKNLLSEHGKANNKMLTEKYGIRGFPTVLILDDEGKMVSKMGYDDGGPERYLEKIAEVTKYGPDIKKYIYPIKEVLNRPEDEMQKAMQEAMRRVAVKFIPVYEKAFKEARAMQVPAHIENKKAEVISNQERSFRQLKSLAEEDKGKKSGKAKKAKDKK